MHLTLALTAVLASAVSAQSIKGFNYGSTFTTGAAKQQADFEAEFNQAKGLVGAPGFTSARLYTMIQAGTTNTPISAIPAALATQTRLLLGLWGSGGQAGIENEIAALTAAIQQYGTAFTGLIDGISVGSEDLYRVSPTGIENNSGAGAGPTDIANYIGQVRTAIRGTAASGASIGHVDTWTAWVNNTNQPTIDACDWIGMDAYPYFQNTIANGIDVGQSVFNDALGATRGAVGGKPVWITETGWPVSGPQQNQAVANVANAKTYWDQVACEYMGNTNLWWYTLQDALPDTPSPSFGLVGAAGGTTPLYDLTCPNGAAASPSPARSASSVAIPTAGTQAPAPGAGSPDATSVAPSPGSSGAQTYAPAQSTPSSEARVSPAPAAASPSQYMTTWVTTTICPVTKTEAGQVSTGLSTSVLTVTSSVVKPDTDKTSAPVAPQSASSQPAAPAPSAAAPNSGACPAALSGQYEYPHLIVPVDKTQPNTALGTSYDGKITPDVSSIFNFDIPPTDAGKTCSLVFLFPEHGTMETSNFTLSGAGGIDVLGLSAPADQGTTYANVPASSGKVGSLPSVTPGNSYTIATGPCAAGKRIGYEAVATGSLDLEYFQDYNPSPIGMYVTVC